MRSVPRRYWMAVGTIALGTAIVKRTAWAAERRRQLRDGEIRALGSLRVRAAGARVFARAATSAASPGRPPVVLVHGCGVSGAYFVPAAERLATEFAVFAPDLPGHGKSDTPPEPLDIPGLADALIAWMDALGLGRSCLVANSMGCQIIVDAAVRYPERVDRLVLIGPSADPRARTMLDYLGRLLLCGPFDCVSALLPLAADYVRMGPRILAEIRCLLRDRMTAKLPSVAAPTLLVRGRHDAIAPDRWLEEAAALLGTRRIVVIPRWGHVVHYSDAPRVVDAIAPFLRAAPRQPASPAGAVARPRPGLPATSPD